MRGPVANSIAYLLLPLYFVLIPVIAVGETGEIEKIEKGVWTKRSVAGFVCDTKEEAQAWFDTYLHKKKGETKKMTFVWGLTTSCEVKEVRIMVIEWYEAGKVTVDDIESEWLLAKDYWSPIPTSQSTSLSKNGG